MDVCVSSLWKFIILLLPKFYKKKLFRFQCKIEFINSDRLESLQSKVEVYVSVHMEVKGALFRP